MNQVDVGQYEMFRCMSLSSFHCSKQLMTSNWLVHVGLNKLIRNYLKSQVVSVLNLTYFQDENDIHTVI